MREPVVVGNWKMHTTLAEARALAQGVRDGCRGLTGVRVVLCPPFTALGAVSQVLAASAIHVGAQDCHWATQGAYTGAVSPAQIADAGARTVILGHSERRALFGETDEVVGQKVAAALAAGLVPLVCVGETAAERAAGRTEAVVERQVRAALQDRSAEEIGRAWLAYEPVWAIGAWQAATPAQAAEVHARLREVVAELATSAVAQRCPILYGGSLKPDNAAAIFAEAAVDGGLVGGASLKAVDFVEIVRAAPSAKGRAGSPSH
jgi:triosephosphate isomerase (TIM)